MKGVEQKGELESAITKSIRSRAFDRSVYTMHYTGYTGSGTSTTVKLGELLVCRRFAWLTGRVQIES